LTHGFKKGAKLKAEVDRASAYKHHWETSR
jgi:hypothetical protein